MALLIQKSNYDVLDSINLQFTIKFLRTGPKKIFFWKIMISFAVSQGPVSKWGFSKWGLERTLANGFEHF